MRSINTFLNVALSFALIAALAAIGLPRLSVSAATPTPEPVEQSPQAPVCDASRTVDVSGTAVINVAPDRVLIQLGVQSNGISPKEVQRRNAAAISRVRAAIQKLGVKATDITSDNYIIEPIYEDYDALYIKGYRIYNVLAVTLKEVTRASDVIAAAFEAGANQVVNVEFYTSELRTHRDRARALAMEAADQKAKALAGAVGAETGCVLRISENSWYLLQRLVAEKQPGALGAERRAERHPLPGAAASRWQRVRSARGTSRSRRRFRSPLD